MTKPQPTDRAVRHWRGLFLYLQTALGTLLVVSYIPSSRGLPYIDHFYSPVRAGIVEGLAGGLTLFLFFASPLFFKRLGVLAITAWVIAIAGVVCMAWPQF